jgi:hypothetical protein
MVAPLRYRTPAVTAVLLGLFMGAVPSQTWRSCMYVCRAATGGDGGGDGGGGVDGGVQLLEAVSPT